MRAGVAVIVAITCLVPVLARTQPDTAGADVVLDVLLHPDVMTVLQLPETVVSARTLHRAEFRVGFFASRVYVQPRPDTPAGREALLEVETTARLRRFRLRVVARASDAAQIFPVHAPEAEQGAPAPQPVAPPEAAPAPSAPPSLPDASSPHRLSDPDHASASEPTAPIDARTTPAANGRPLALSIHAVGALAGATAVNVAGYEPDDARQSHRAFSLRLAATPRHAHWSLEASIGGEWLAAPTRHSRLVSPLEEVLTVRGPWLRADVGIRARLGTTLMPTAYAGLGLQARFLEKELTSDDPSLPEPDEVPAESRQDMPFGGVLALGLGVEYRTGNVLLGLELHMRQGVPADYRSVSALLSLGFYLDHGE